MGKIMAILLGVGLVGLAFVSWLQPWAKTQTNTVMQSSSSQVSSASSYSGS